jgi:hypothetical protein
MHNPARKAYKVKPSKYLFVRGDTSLDWLAKEVLKHLLDVSQLGQLAGVKAKQVLPKRREPV